MIWIKSVLVGLAAAILIMIVTVGLLISAISVNIGEGAGGIGAVSAGISEFVFLPTLVAFVIGFWWTVRRQRRKRSVTARP